MLSVFPQKYSSSIIHDLSGITIPPASQVRGPKDVVNVAFSSLDESHLQVLLLLYIARWSHSRQAGARVKQWNRQLSILQPPEVTETSTNWWYPRPPNKQRHRNLQRPRTGLIPSERKDFCSQQSDASDKTCGCLTTYKRPLLPHTVPDGSPNRTEILWGLEEKRWVPSTDSGWTAHCCLLSPPSTA